MPWRVALARVRELLTRRRLEGDLHEELDTHLSLLEDEHVRRGLDRASGGTRRHPGPLDVCTRAGGVGPGVRSQ